MSARTSRVVFGTALLGLALWGLGATGWAGAADEPRKAVVLAIEGKAFAVSAAGQEQPIRRGENLLAGAEVRTGPGCRMDLYFRQIGTVVRLMPQTALKLDKLAKSSRDGVVVKETALNLRQGRLLCCVRLLVPESKFEIRTPTTLFQMPAVGLGRYDLYSDGSVIVGKKSAVALRALSVAGSTKTNVVPPGQGLGPQAGAAGMIDPKVREDLLVQFDEMQMLAENLTPAPRPEELPRK